MEQATTNTVDVTSSRPSIDACEASELLQGSILAIESPSDSENEEGVYSVDEIESDRDEGIEKSDIGVMKYGLRSKKRGRLADSSSEKDDDHTSSSPKRRKTAITRKRGHTQNKTVKVFVPPEIWLKIFSFSQPTFLAQARGVSKAFKALIDDEKVWKCARIHHFPEYPDPVLGLKEWEMWNLYLGVGCMICRAPKIKKRYWRFRIRCCVDCLKQCTIKEYLLKERPGFQPQWIQYLIHGALDSWGNWTTPSTGPHTYFQKTFWLDDVKVLEMRMRPHLIAGKILKAEALQAQKDIEKIEDFESKLSKEKGKGADLICRQRCVDIKEKCSHLDPPFTGAILCYIPAYQSAIRTSRPLTDRSWKILLKKLEAGREAAELKIAEVKRMTKEMELSRNGHMASAPMKSWIDLFLSQNGGAVERGCEASFALQALNYVRTRWFAKGERRIPLSTVQLLWDERLNNILKGPGRIFMCAFCDKRHGLDAVFNHITMVHFRDMGWTEVSGDRSFNYCSWRNQEWPAELPILPYGKIFEGTKQSIEGASKPKQAPSKPRQVLPTLNVPGPRIVLSTKLAPGHKAIRELHQTKMNEILSKIQNFKSIPDSYRFFLWFRLSIASYLREYNQVPNLTIFALAADITQQQRKEPLLRSLLKCGVCGANQTHKRKPFIWLTLVSHFNAHSNTKDQPWLEKLLVLPNKADIFKSCSQISDLTARKQWIEMVREADSDLGAMLDDGMRVGGEKTNLKNILEGKDSKEVALQGKDAHHLSSLWQPIRPRPERGGRVSFGGVSFEANKERDQKSGREWGRSGGEVVRWKRGEADPSGSLQYNIQPEAQGDRISSYGDIHIKMKLADRSREVEPLREPKRRFESERSSWVEHEKKRLRVGHVSPAPGDLNTVTYKNMPVPQFSTILPRAIVKISRPLETPNKDVKTSPTIQVMPVEIQILVKPTDHVSDKSKELLEVCEIRDRSLSPSIDVDIEELFADA